jgi:hypothetical protein
MALPFLFQHFNRNSSISMINSDTTFVGNTQLKQSAAVADFDEGINNSDNIV